MGGSGRRVPELVSGLGLFFLVVTVGEGLYVLFVSNPLGAIWLAGLVTSLPFIVALLYAGRHLADSAVSASRYTRLGYWCVGGLSLFLAINIIIMVTMPPESGLRLVSWGRWAATLGSGTGLIVGFFEARGIERAVEAERERVRAEEAEAREELLEYLNATLRHEILNTANVIIGNANLVIEEHDDNGTIVDRMDTIKTQTEEMESVIEDVNVLLRASRGAEDAKQVDLVSLLTGEIASLRDSVETVEIETSMPDRAIVSANQALRRVFSNLLWNAVEHNDSAVPRITITVDRKPETVVIRIEDDGPGVPRSERGTLFEGEIRTDANHGLGLPLSATLVGRFDGTIELTETGPEGTTFTVELPRNSGTSPADPTPDVQQSFPDRERSSTPRGQ